MATATETTEAPPKRDIKDAFGHISKALDKLKGRNPTLFAEANQRIAAHIRAITDGKFINLPIYHASDIDDEAKFQTYKVIFNALIAPQGPDFSKLVMTTTQKEEPAAPSEAGRQPAQSTVVPTTDRTILPRVTPVKTEDADEEGALAREILRLVEKRAKVSGQVDEEQVQAIIEASFKDLLDKHLSNGSFPTDRVEEIVKKVAAVQTARIEFVVNKDALGSIEGLVHPQATQLATWLRAGIPVWGWGAAGSGKTHMARQIAELLGVEACVMSVDPTLTVSKIMGYRNVANGDFIEGFAYKPFKDGGLFAQDEIDTGDPGVIASANALLSNEDYLFPNGETVERHEKFYALALANTKGMGAVAGYTARNRLDAATLDRFAIIEIKYDAGLERCLAYGGSGANRPGEPWKPGKPASYETQQRYVEWVQQVRAFVKDSVLVSPRASINGCKALRAGVPLSEVIDALVFKLIADDSRKRIIDQCGLPTE